jgi:hypothetical protein
MVKSYEISLDQRAVLDMSSVLEDAAYLLTEGMPYVEVKNMGSSNCKSSNSSSSPCRATGIEHTVESK